MMKTQKNIKKKNKQSKKLSTILHKKTVSNTFFKGTGQIFIFGLLYFEKRYNLDIPFIYQDKKDLMYYGINYICEKKDFELTIPMNTSIFFNYIKRSKKRFLAIHIFIKDMCKTNIKHFNSLIIDKQNKIVERYDPITIYNMELSKIFIELDKKLNLLVKEQLPTYKYKTSNDICPLQGFQSKEENNLLSKRTTRITNNYVLENDPKGFCGAWNLYYINMRLKYPDLEPNDLIKKIYSIMENDKHSMRTFIRNYSMFLVQKADYITKVYKINRNSFNHNIRKYIEEKNL